MTVNPLPVVNPGPDTSICSGQTFTFDAGACIGCSYQWGNLTLGLMNIGNGQTYTTGQAAEYMVTKTDALGCVNRDTVNLTVNNQSPVSVNMTSSVNPVCQGNPVQFTAIPVNGGITPSFQWKVNGVNAGTNSSTFSFNPLSGDIIQCVMNSSLTCITNNPATSNMIVMNALPVPSVSFTLCFDSITTLNAVPFILKGGVPLGGTYSGPGVNSVTGFFTPSIAGVGTKTVTYSYTNVSLCTAVMTKTIIVQPAPAFNCGNNLTDIRDNKIYQTVQIGTQCWMRKNLNYGNLITGTVEQTDNCVNEKYFYADNAADCNLYGGLYQWDEVMAYGNTPGSQGLCPPGWHIPTQGEWMTLFNANLTQGLAGKPLQDSIINGFRAIESGVDYSNIVWKFSGFATIFWSSNSFGAIKALTHGMNLQNFGVSDYYSNRSNAFAIRCLKN